MGLFKRIEKRASPSGTWARWAADVESPTQSTSSGIPINPKKARSLPAVWACQSLIADAIASLPIDTYRKTRNRRVQLTNPRWIANPNAFQTPYTFWHTVLISLLGEDGNAFILLGRNEAGEIVTAFPVDPDRVQVDEESPTPMFTLDGTPLTDREILHIPAFTVPGKRRGISIIEHNREAIALALAAEEYGARFFSQSTTMSGVVEHPGTPKPAEVAIMAKTLRKTHTGLKNSHAMGILTGGAKWVSASATPEQSQFLETRRFQNIEIAKIYRVPPHMIDPSVQSSWGSGVEEQNLFFIEETLMPWLVRIEQAVSRLLPGGQYIKFNLSAKLRAKTTERYAAYSTAISSGWMNPDEARVKEDLEPIPGGKGKKFYIPSKLVELGEKPEPTATPPPGDGGEEDDEQNDDGGLDGAGD